MMKLKFATVAMGSVLLLTSACATTKPTQPVGETRECAQYRAMMVAPMLPSALERLRLNCEASKTQN